MTAKNVLTSWPPERLAELKLLVATMTIGEAAGKMGVTKGMASGALARAALRGEYDRPSDIAGQPEKWRPPEPKGCRWIDADPAKPGWSWCDAKPDRFGSPWCAAHHKRAWAPRP